MTFWSEGKILVTGGGGFIGSHLTEELLSRGAAVTVADRDAARTAHNLASAGNARVLIGDLSDAAFADQATRGQSVAFHLASKMAGLKYNALHPAEMLVENSLLDLQVLKWCSRNKVQVVFCSGALVYDRDRPIPTPEDAPVNGDPNQDCEGSAWAKRIGEKAALFFARETGMKVAIARLANVYGPRDDFCEETAHLVGNAIRRAARGEKPELHGDGSALRAFLYVTDAVEALLRLAEVDCHGQPINICALTEISTRNVIAEVMRAASMDGALTPAKGPTGMQRRLLDSSRFRSLTGFQERVSFADGIRLTMQWYLKHRSE